MLEKDTGVQALPVLQTAIVINQINLKKKNSEARYYSYFMNKNLGNPIL